MIFWQRDKYKKQIWLTKEVFVIRYERDKKKMLEWRLANPDRVRENNKKGRVGKEAERAAYCKAWRAKNPDKCRQLQKDWRARNPDRRDASNARFFAKNPGAKMELRNRHRARDAGVPIGPGKPMWVVYEMAKRVTKCTGIRFHVDHVIPLSRGGAHDLSNIQVITRQANQRKFNRLPHEIQAA